MHTMRSFGGLLRALYAAVLAGSLIARPVSAASAVGNLGGPLNVVSPYPAIPLSGFHRVTGTVRAGGKAELLFLGTLTALELHTIPNLPQRGFLLADDRSAAERWPVVKALGWFGSLGGLRIAPQRCVPSQRVAGARVCDVGTFDWSHATYRSRYVAFVHRDLLDAAGRRYQAMTARERGLYYRYARNTQCLFRTPGMHADAPDDLLATVCSEMTPEASSTRSLPLVAVGDYLQTISQLTPAGAFQAAVFPSPMPGPGTPVPSDTTGLSFAQVQRAMISTIEPNAYSRLVVYVNAEANIIAALICHADGEKPGSVCRRPAIREIMRHVR